MTPAGRDRAPILGARGIIRDFPGVRALDGVDLDLLPGEVHALVGENGAGKSTLMHILAGVLQPGGGQVLVDGSPVTFRTRQDAARVGISVVFQELSLAPDLAVCENVFTNTQPVGPGGLVNRAELRRRTAAMLDEFGFPCDPESPVSALGPAGRQVVEILKAFSAAPRVVILDEPTSSLGASEKQALFAAIRRMKASGVGFVYISHHLSEVFELADRITVLRDGKRVVTRQAADSSEQELVRDMVGRDLQDLYGMPAGTPGDPSFEVRDAVGPGFGPVSLSVRRGEIVGVAGLAGCGRTEMARALFGVEPLSSGSVTLEGRLLRVSRPGEAIADGIAYLTESRKDDGLFVEMSIRQNLAAPSLARFTGAGGLVRDGAIGQSAEEARRRFGIAAPGVDTAVSGLSGGNQQKVLFAMWAGTNPRVLIADEPTRGVDVGARAEIYAVLRRLASDGVAVLLISSDLPEILGMSDRVLVMRQGRVVAGFDRAEATEEAIVARAAGVATGEGGGAACSD